MRIGRRRGEVADPVPGSSRPAPYKPRRRRSNRRTYVLANAPRDVLLFVDSIRVAQPSVREDTLNERRNTARRLEFWEGDTVLTGPAGGKPSARGREMRYRFAVVSARPKASTEPLSSSIPAGKPGRAKQMVSPGSGWLPAEAAGSVVR